ncbi:LamG-like jellyroll fold domain-containing protein [Fulvivirga sediminis]|uniref:PKD domain-containing protein n=1 Tax=Fulvivirga sediminis TaxID=2803949 RepID=A0A937FAH4_9BACT|nr:LamG-like jellyroll fold domain-containing protein [Fulvivirga sediminis]MBL3657274.1 hypothetical protein [Fulvivirga sediminis]
MFSGNKLISPNQFLAIIIFFLISGCKKKDSPVPLPVTASFLVSDSITVTNDTIQFTNNSRGVPQLLKWIFEGGSPSSSKEENPKVTYTKTDRYTVKLVAARGELSDVIIKKRYINVLQPLSGMIAHYKIDNSFRDETGNHGLLVNADWYYPKLVDNRFGNRYSAVDFSKKYTSVFFEKCEEMNNLESLSFSCWLKIDSLIDKYRFNRHIISSQVYNDDRRLYDNGFVIGLSNTGVYMSIGHQFNSFGTTFIFNEWVHLVCTYRNEGAIASIYINGNLANSRELSYGSLALYSTNPRVTIGYSDRNFDGILDDLRIFNRAINQYEVDSLYNSK